jgi:hypothetical protein
MSMRESDTVPAPLRFRAYCTGMSITLAVYAVAVIVLLVLSRDDRGWDVGQQVLCAAALLVMAGLMLWERRLVVDGQLNPEVAVKRTKVVRAAAIAAGLAVLVGAFFTSVDATFTLVPSVPAVSMAMIIAFSTPRLV